MDIKFVVSPTKNNPISTRLNSIYGKLIFLGQLNLGMLSLSYRIAKIGKIEQEVDVQI